MKCLTGIPRIDAQHEVLGNILNRLIALSKQDGVGVDAVRGIVFELRDYCIYHFEVEEEVMDSLDGSPATENKAAHYYFVTRVIEIERMLDIRSPMENITSLSVLLHHWIEKHICEIDCKIRGLKWRKQSGKPQ